MKAKNIGGRAPNGTAQANFSTVPLSAVAQKVRPRMPRPLQQSTSINRSIGIGF